MLVGVPREEPDDGLEGKIGINRPPIRVVDQVNSENTVGKGTSVSFLGFFLFQQMVLDCQAWRYQKCLF